MSWLSRQFPAGRPCSPASPESWSSHLVATRQSTELLAFTTSTPARVLSDSCSQPSLSQCFVVEIRAMLCNRRMEHAAKCGWFIPGSGFPVPIPVGERGLHLHRRPGRRTLEKGSERWRLRLHSFEAQQGRNASDGRRGCLSHLTLKNRRVSIQAAGLDARAEPWPGEAGPFTCDWQITV